MTAHYTLLQPPRSLYISPWLSHLIIVHLSTFGCHSKCLHFIYIFGLHLIEPTTLRFDSLIFHFTVLRALTRLLLLLLQNVDIVLSPDSFTLILSTLLFICHRCSQDMQSCVASTTTARWCTVGWGRANLCTHNKDFPILKLIYIVDGMKILRNYKTKSSTQPGAAPPAVLNSLWWGATLNTVRAVGVRREEKLSFSSMKIIRRRLVNQESFPSHRTHSTLFLLARALKSLISPHEKR